MAVVDKQYPCNIDLGKVILMTQPPYMGVKKHLNHHIWHLNAYLKRHVLAHIYN
jgi:hypothetical protein